ncbi:transcriptional regulator, AbrB family [Desulfofarcimen acetoxidans DSM 771]|uniref:Transcriptional regulator, AbrB family n=1 Tax=Desulfofarcimen acetoxidans (strain ATCC 49208 / DSM 771 / KCTC 5769 / VKM B-1644 / 5575) TaxID=485916 RepID=C8W0Q0_DESAS|nr:AbrB/MazE/SpoVT family DNA-binding domain-containing protein [Desulfofarcimen acetoxidans]ACV63305.1 transcriptional regulator, AbrB family [Desulfofarcimen acetoxidans DSM 771]
MYTVTVSSRGQIVLPAEIRKNLLIKEGDELTVRLETGGRITFSTKHKVKNKGIVAATAGLLSDMEVSGKEFVENIRRGSGRRLDEIESSS